MIDGVTYANEIRYILQSSGALVVQEIKEKLLSRKIKIDDIQILQATDLLLRQGKIQRSGINKFIRKSLI